MKTTSPARTRRPLWRQLLRLVSLVAALALVFGWLLPQFIDYEEVWEALTELDAWEVLVLVGLGLARVPSEALMYRAFLPGWQRPPMARLLLGHRPAAGAITLSRFRKTNPDVLASAAGSAE